jgi:hypothetical protein
LQAAQSEVEAGAVVSVVAAVIIITVRTSASFINQFQP